MGASATCWIWHDASASYTKLSKKEFMTDDSSGQPRYRPAFVFGYYSGPSDRLAEVFEKHSERFYSAIIKAPESRIGIARVDPNALRRLFYARTLHGQFVLLAFFMSPDITGEEDRIFLREELKISGLDSVLFEFRDPPWNGKGGDPRFWNAEGEVREFLDILYREAFFPMRMKRRLQVDLTRKPSVECLYLFLPDQSALAEVYAAYGDQYAFFTALESTHLSKLLIGVRARVRLTVGSGSENVTYRDLSEGEQQLLLVLGLLRFTARDEALFLLDEPDTHLNPLWSTQYLKFLDRFIQGRDRRNCHILMSTHDPLVFAGLRRPQVRIFQRGPQGSVVVATPEQDPQGMGVGAILTSDLFRLRSTLDEETQRNLDRQRILSMGGLTSDEKEELLQINRRLWGLGLMGSSRDPLYAKFVRAWTEREDAAWREETTLTPDELKARDRLAAEIVQELAEEESRSQ
jgi:ABC-type transport system involved in cytochrome c biogenesis ATPase subunit